ncbi:hypothetical protein cyc_07749 [Cyclospora cayetanensis]|uniref:Uncharacterized protein n=1 Tax=Cyclospora cayetanensis TaxID=88456 RepID=A0A1D3D5X3_9EIME|nr:hypothetical protein cyc_07749 [Cyclospora cayetanensis]
MRGQLTGLAFRRVAAAHCPSPPPAASANAFPAACRPLVSSYPTILTSLAKAASSTPPGGQRCFRRTAATRCDGTEAQTNAARNSHELPPPERSGLQSPSVSTELNAQSASASEGGECVASADTSYQAAADALLEGLAEQLQDAQEAAGLEDVDCRDGVLKVVCRGGATFVLNKHYVTRQICGAQYFEYSLAWRCARTGTSLLEALSRDLLTGTGLRPPTLTWPDGCLKNP